MVALGEQSACGRELRGRVMRGGHGDGDRMAGTVPTPLLTKSGAGIVGFVSSVGAIVIVVAALAVSGTAAGMSTAGVASGSIDSVLECVSC